MGRTWCLPFLAALTLGIGGCSEDASTPKPTSSPDGGPPSGCAPGELTLPDGACQAAGVPPERCGAGFEPDGAGACRAIQPEAPCGPGQIAQLGEQTCHEVAPCAPGTWGDIAIDGDTELVDAAYAGGASDGSEAAPWTTIQDAFDAAARGALIAVAAGSYAALDLQGKAVRIQGRCPSLVEVKSSSADQAAIMLRNGLDGTEIRDIAMTGPTHGFAISGSEGVVLERVWIHDTAGPGILAEDALGTTQLTVRGSLIEATGSAAILARGSEVEVASSVLRDTAAGEVDSPGRGCNVQESLTSDRRGKLGLEGVVIERAHDMGIFAQTSDVDVSASLIRETSPVSWASSTGRGISVQAGAAGPTSLSVSASVIETSREIGVFITGSDATIEATVVRDTQPRDADGAAGRGLQISSSGAQRANVTLRASVVERSMEAGVVVFGSDVLLEGVAIRDTAPQASDQTAGRGVDVQDDGVARSSLTLRGSLVRSSHGIGVAALGSDLTIEDTAVEATLAQASDGNLGRGVHVQHTPPAQRGQLAIRRSRIAGSLDQGVLVIGSDAVLEGVEITDTAARQTDGLFGDGLVVGDGDGVAASATVSSTTVASSARAGIAAFGATIQVGGTKVECNVIDLAGETNFSPSFSFVDTGGNVCGCGGATRPCKVLTSSLDPPSPVGGVSGR